MDVELRVTLEDGALPPEYRTGGSAGMDVRIVESVELKPQERKLVRTGLRMQIPEGYEGQIRPRSSLALEYGVTMANSPGTIDSDYRGELKLILLNTGRHPVKLAKGDRVAQLVICPVTRATVSIVDTLEESERGDGGFGSTGRQ
jgi:dUTP pyrophosphatase